MPTVKKPITVRLDPTLLEQVRRGAARDNRSVTNFIETALRQRLTRRVSDGAVARRRKTHHPRPTGGDGIK